MENLEDVETFLAALKVCDESVPHKKGLGEKKSYVLIQMMKLMYFRQLCHRKSYDIKRSAKDVHSREVDGNRTISCLAVRSRLSIRQYSPKKHYRI